MKKACSNANLTIGHFSVDVQKLVEQPYEHIIAQASSSVDDQLYYSDERRNELKSISTPIKAYGREYRDVVRFFSGKSNKLIL